MVECYYRPAEPNHLVPVNVHRLGEVGRLVSVFGRVRGHKHRRLRRPGRRLNTATRWFWFQRNW